MIKINIYLIGMMGSGKSTIGQILADRLNMSWTDMDESIENKGMPIPEIFEKHGEAHFRQIESQVVKETAELNNCVVSTGGGVILNEANVEVMKASGRVVYLKATKETLLSNLEKGRENRPLIKTGDLSEKLEALMSARGEKYTESADAIVATDGLKPDEIALGIISLLNL